MSALDFLDDQLAALAADGLERSLRRLDSPQAVEAGPKPFDTYSYQMSVIGRYDQIGQFLADVASLQRIIVPYNMSIVAANLTSAKALGDTTGSLLEARFQVRTYVKSPTPEGEASGS